MVVTRIDCFSRALSEVFPGRKLSSASKGRCDGSTVGILVTRGFERNLAEVERGRVVFEFTGVR